MRPRGLYGYGNAPFSKASRGKFHVLSQEPARLGTRQRVVAGLILVACGLIGLPAAPLGYLFAASGAVAILTGFFGFCPMCAMVGRKLPSA
jgi:hypothetical protein